MNIRSTLAAAALTLTISHTAHSAEHWTFKKQIDPLTDVATFMVFAEAEPKQRPPVGVGVICTNNKSAVMFITGPTGIADSFTLHYRFDKNPPAAVKTQSVDMQTLAVIGGEASSIISGMKASKQIFFRAELPISSRSEGTVSLLGFSKAFAKIAEHCS